MDNDRNFLTPNKPDKTQPSRLSGLEHALVALTLLSESLPRQGGAQPLSPEALAFMGEGLADLTPKQLSAAAAAAREHCRWFPTVAELRELAGARAPSAEEQQRAEELAAWEQAVHWVRRYAGRLYNRETGRLDGFTDENDYSWTRTPPKPIVPLPPRVEWALRQVGGAQALAESLEEPEAKQQWLRKAFAEAYRLAEAAEEARQDLLAAPPEVLRLVDSVAGRLEAGRQKRAPLG